MGDIVAQRGPTSVATAQPISDGDDFDFVKSVGETGYSGKESEAGSFKDASDSSFGQDIENLLGEMRRAISELGLPGDGYKAPDLLRFLRARSNNIKKASKLFVDHEVCCPKPIFTYGSVSSDGFKGLTLKWAPLRTLE